MIHHQYNPNYKFVKEPVEFNKYTESGLLKYCLGATMYMPGTKDFAQAIIDKRYPGLTSMVMCFEAACKPEEIPVAEQNSVRLLEALYEAIQAGKLNQDDIPLIFFRVRNIDQFKQFSSMLKEHISLIVGFNFPKFNTENGDAFFDYLEELNQKYGELFMYANN